MKKNRFIPLIALILIMCCTLGYAIMSFKSSITEETPVEEIESKTFEIDGLIYNVIDESNRYVEVSKVEDTVVDVPMVDTVVDVPMVDTVVDVPVVDTVVDVTEYTEIVKIPSTVTIDGITYTVTSIGDYAFAGCSSLTTITLPKHITNINKLEIPEGARIIRR